MWSNGKLMMMQVDGTKAKDAKGIRKYVGEVARRKCNVLQGCPSAATIAELHKEGIKILYYINAHILDQIDKDIFFQKTDKRHSEWAQRMADGSFVEIYVKRGERGKTSNCINAEGWRRHICNRIIQTAKTLDVDGIFLDGPAFFPGSCYCANCRKKFRKAFGEEIPAVAHLSDPLFKKFIQWRYDCMKEFLKDAKAALASVNPRLPLYMNARGMKGFTRGCARYVGDLAEHEDIVGAEDFMYFRERNVERPLWQPGATAKFMCAAARPYNKPAVVFSNAYPTPWTKRPFPAGMLKLNMTQVLFNGAGIWLDGVKLHAPDVVAEIHGFFAGHRKYFENRVSAANVAMLWSRKTCDFYAVDPGRDPLGDWNAKDEKSIAAEDLLRDYRSCFHGLYEALLRNCIPFDLVLDKDIESDRLKQYKVLVLADAACLSAKQCAVIKAFVAHGGGLIATYETSLYNERGVKRRNFELAELFHANTKGVKLGLGNQGDYIHAAESSHPILNDARNPMPSPACILTVKAGPGALRLGSLVRQGAGGSADIPKAERPPVLLAAEHGKGRVFYVAGDIGARYVHIKWPEIKQLVGNAVNWVGRTSLPVEIDAPGMVEAILTRQKDGSKLFLHLVNYTGEMIGPMLNRTVPLHDIRIRLKKVRAAKVSRITTLRKKHKLTMGRKGGCLEFILPVLDDYETVVIEFK
ncbi:MAG: DUF6259 domain-containing protein [Kiritimatiellae bacterium]|nr:DUF6259 domain-containing protein [Kiritimatiellia bacterium]